MTTTKTLLKSKNPNKHVEFLLFQETTVDGYNLTRPISQNEIRHMTAVELCSSWQDRHFFFLENNPEAWVFCYCEQKVSTTQQCFHLPTATVFNWLLFSPPQTFVPGGIPTGRDQKTLFCNLISTPEAFEYSTLSFCYIHVDLMKTGIMRRAALTLCILQDILWKRRPAGNNCILTVVKILHK